MKIAGYRIELGEIETALSRHHAVRQSVVVARPGTNDAPSLVAYVVPAEVTSEESDVDRVRDWQNLWDEAYSAGFNGGDPRFRISGWNDSFTGEPIPPTEMREWVDRTVERILALQPKRVLEIGCGTGMILYRVLPHVEHYTGTDVSRAGLESIRRELTPSEAAKVTLLQNPAHAIEGVAEKSFDVVVINSVAQYFPDAKYLTRVLRRATELVADGGHIFVGDVRSLAHLDAFHTEIELRHPERTEGSAFSSPVAKADPSVAALPQDDMRRRVEARTAREGELVLDEAFFHALVRDVPRLSGLDVELKRGTARNEMTRYRYDVVLYVGQPALTAATSEDDERVVALAAPTADDIRAKIADKASVLRLFDVPNARLTDGGVDPEMLYTLDGYAASTRWASSGDPMRFDAVVWDTRSGTVPAWPFPAPSHSGTPSAYANTPVRARDDATITTQLRAHLRQSLPEYMVPATFVVLDALPLTPNGKIDRKALPAPTDRVRPTSAHYVAPTNDLEQQIADVWRELLAVERVGRQDNIFDLGANSLLTMQANNRLSTVLGRKVSLVSMFRYPTVESLANHLAENGTASATTRATEKKAQERASRAEQAAERRRALRAERKDK